MTASPSTAAYFTSDDYLRFFSTEDMPMIGSIPILVPQRTKTIAAHHQYESFPFPRTLIVVIALAALCCFLVVWEAMEATYGAIPLYVYFAGGAGGVLAIIDIPLIVDLVRKSYRHKQKLDVHKKAIEAFVNEVGADAKGRPMYHYLCAERKFGSDILAKAILHTGSTSKQLGDVYFFPAEKPRSLYQYIDKLYLSFWYGIR